MNNKLNELLKELEVEVKKSIGSKIADSENLKNISRIQTEINQIKKESKNI